MPHSFFRLIFAGGVKQTDKTNILQEAVDALCLEGINIEFIHIGKYFEGVSNFAEEFWKEKEREATNKVISDIKGVKSGCICLINNHFATESPAGFSPGLDMNNLIQIIRLLEKGKAKKDGLKFGVLLYEAKANYVSSTREEQDKHKFGCQSWKDTCPELRCCISENRIQRELELNRVYATQYYLAASSVWGASSVDFKCLNVNGENRSSILDNTKEFIRRYAAK